MITERTEIGDTVRSFTAKGHAAIAVSRYSVVVYSDQKMLVVTWNPETERMDVAL